MKIATTAVIQYLYLLSGLDTAEHTYPGKYRMVFNNWDGWCESTISINIDPESKTVSYKMYYNGAKVKNDIQRTALLNYFKRVDKSFEDEKCCGGIEDNGAVFVEIKRMCDYSLTCKELQQFEKICTNRIWDDRYAIKRYLKATGGCKDE